MADQHGPLYRNIEFCRNAETLWNKLQSGHWDWLGVHPRGQFILGSPRLNLQSHMFGIASVHNCEPEAEEGRHGVRYSEWLGQPSSRPASEWFNEEAEAKSRYEELLERYRRRSVVLAKVCRIEGGFPAEEEFIACTPPPNFQ